MSSDSKTEINKFLQKFPKSEVVSILKQIDQKIDSLHTISSKDFLFFNQMLKNYYQKIKEVSEKNGSLNATLSKTIPECVAALKTRNDNQKEFAVEINRNVGKLADLFSLTFGSFSLTIVPFKNYKQNLITLKYILANLKLHLSYVNLSNKDNFKEQLHSLETRLDTSVLKVDDVNEGIKLFSSELLSLKEKSMAINNKNSVTLCDQILSLNKGLNRILLNDYWSSEMIMNINTHTQMCFSNMGEVITNLQYHDIIRQKMEHIQESQQALIEGIDNISDTPNSSGEYDELLGFVVRVPEVTSLQVAQLLYTNKDYQTSLERISNKLLEVSREMRKLNEIYSVANQNAQKFDDKFLSDITLAQKDFEIFLSQIKNGWFNISPSIEEIFSKYSVLKDSLQVTFAEEKEIRREIRLLEKLIKENGKDFSIELVKKLSQIMSDLQLNSNSLKNHFNGVTQQMNNSLVMFNKLKGNFTDTEDASSAIEELKRELSTAESRAYDQAEASLKVSEEISSSLHKVEYYTYFKSTVESIVDLLNSISDQVDFDSVAQFFNGNDEALEKIKKNYTMQSERAIHDEVFENSDTELNIEDESTLDENDVELF